MRTTLKKVRTGSASPSPQAMCVCYGPAGRRRRRRPAGRVARGRRGTRRGRATDTAGPRAV
eukprot:1115204-Prymnesium_polylepis.1